MSAPVFRKYNAKKRTRHVFVIISIAWTLIMSGLFVIYYQNEHRSAISSARSSAVHSIRKDLLYGKWALSHGGVYVPVSDKTPPDQHLAGLPKRDVETVSGEKLTLLNPVRMIRQVNELGSEKYGVHRHITSLNTLTPENAPDEWERTALRSLEDGSSDFYGLGMIGENQYFRYMAPLKVEPVCLNCHADRGYRVGEVRGGIAVSLPWDEFHSSFIAEAKTVAAMYGTVWLIGLIGCFWAKRVITSHIDEQEDAVDALAKSEKMLSAVLQASPAGIGLIKDRVVQWGNEALVEMTGYSRDEISLSPSSQFYENEAEYERVGAFAYTEIAERGKASVETRFQRKDGHFLDVFMSLAAVDKNDLSNGVVFVIVDVGESRKIARQLQDNVQRMERAELAARFGNWELDLTTGKVKGSKGALHVYGLQQDEMDLKSVQKFPLTEYRTMLDNALSELLQNRKPYDVEFKAVRQSDNMVVDIHSIAEFDPERNVVWGVIQDITQQKRAEEALAESELLYRTLFEGARDPIIIIDMEGEATGRIISANPVAARIHGYSLEEFTTLRLEDLETSVSSEELPVRINKVLSGDQIRGEVDHRRKDGSVFPMELSANLLEIRGHKYCIGLDRDISERRLAEEELKRASDETMLLMQSMTNGFVVFESVFDEKGEFVDCRYQYVNDSFERISGMKRSEVIGKTVYQIWPGTEEEWITNFREVALSGVGKTFELYHSTTDRIHYCTVYRPWESIDRFCLIFEDVTERKRVQEELFEMERKLLQSQKLESLGVLSGGIAHDFNNLLAVIIGNIELAQENDFNLSERQLFLERALSASMKSASLVRQMLDYSGKGAFELKDVNLSELVENNIDMFRMTVPKNINLKFNSCDDDIFVKADVGQIQQVVMNLLINASEAFEGNNGTIEIGAGAQFCGESILCRSHLPERLHPQNMAFITVKDDGMGMDAETVKRIFDPFFSTKFVGRGLGMSVVHGVVRGHHGAVTIDSQPGKGTTVTVYLPLLYRKGGVEGASIPKEIGAGSDGAETPEASKLSVLVVDDEPGVLDLVLRQVQTLGCKTFSAENGVEALNVYNENPEIDMVILDLVMPEMGGVETFDQLKKINPDLMIVICSGYNEEKIKDDFKSELKPIAFVNKPYRYQTLKELIELLRGKRLKGQSHVVSH